MELWDSNFTSLRNNYIVPLTQYQGEYKKSQFNSLKVLLSSRFTSLTNLSGKTFELELEPDLLYTALINDIELFYTRAIVQAADLTRPGGMSSSWRFVTQYYFGFFSITALFRILKRGFVFFSKGECVTFNSLATSLLSSVVHITAGNYSFKYLRTETNGNMIFHFANIGEGVHNKTWNATAELLLDFCNQSDGDEKTILQVMRQMSIDYKPDLPSEVRNIINYHGPYGMRSISDEFTFPIFIMSRSKFVKAILGYKKSSDINTMAKDVGLFGHYLFLLTNDLMVEYYSRRHLKSDFHKARHNYLKKIGLDFDAWIK